MAAVGLVIAATIGGAWFYLTRPHINVARFIKPANPIEMMHTDSHEWLEEHFPAADNSGKDERTRVVFRKTGNIGWRMYRKDHSLAEFIVTRASGETLVHLFYSPRGTQIVSGFEKRNDGTLRRLATTQGDMVTLTVFWQDGKTPFMVDKRKVDEWDHSVQYFHPNGARWTYQVASLYADNATVERDWDDEDRLVREYTVDPNERTGTLTVYRGDGTVRFVQTYAPYEAKEYTEHGEYTVKRRGLKTIDERDGMNRTIRRITMVDGAEAVESVDIFDPNTGEQLAHVPFVKDQAAPIALAADVVNGKIERVKPDNAWKTEEAKVSDIVPKTD
jgi:hypothetical protein